MRRTRRCLATQPRVVFCYTRLIFCYSTFSFKKYVFRYAYIQLSLVWFFFNSEERFAMFFFLWLYQIGQGTYSSVFGAWEPETWRIVASKKARFDNFEPDSVWSIHKTVCDHPSIIKLQETDKIGFLESDSRRRRQDANAHVCETKSRCMCMCPCHEGICAYKYWVCSFAKCLT